MPTTAEFTKSILALFVWQQTGSEVVTEMTAVACVVRNRVQAGWHGGDWLGVMHGHHEIAAQPSPAVRIPDLRDHKFKAVLFHADAVFDGTEPDLTSGAFYFARLTGSEISPWFRENVLAKPDAHHRLGTVGTLTFFA